MDNNTKPYLILQAGISRTGSTVIANLIQGFISKDEKLLGYWNNAYNLDRFHRKVNIAKTHLIDFDPIIDRLKDQFELFFVVSERDDKKIDPKYYCYTNVIIFDYTELLETPEYNTTQLTEHIYNRLRDFFPPDIQMNKDHGLQRLIEMNNYYQQIKDQPFSYVNYFYQLHGSHRTKPGV
jgi:hypothetical protein